MKNGTPAVALEHGIPAVSSVELLSVRRTILSPCRVYRYTLWREWGVGTLPLLGHHENSEAYVMFIGLNPSTADESANDPTIRKCIGFAKRWGYGAVCMTNLFAFRSTDPKQMKAQTCPIGLDNFKWLSSCAIEAELILAAWGTNGKWLRQDQAVMNFLKRMTMKKMMCLRTTKEGHPEHPLYVPYQTLPQLYEPRTDNERDKPTGGANG